MKFLKCPHCDLYINLNHLKGGSSCTICGSSIKILENLEVSNEIKPNF